MPIKSAPSLTIGLTRQEKAKLVQLEDVLATAQRWQCEAAKALVGIRDQKLYRAEHASFEKYAQERWGYERAYLYQLCQWGEVIGNLSAIADMPPQRESHARPLYALSPVDQRRAWRAVLAKTLKPTARDVEEAAAKLRAPLTRGNTSAIPYYGSKAALASEIIAHLPAHRCYVETHVGGASVLLAKPRSQIEVMNDRDDALVNFYKVLRENHDDLVRQLRLTPYSRSEWEDCRRHVDDGDADPVERARRYYVVMSMSYSATGTSFSRSHTKPQAEYHATRVDRLHEVAERLRRVVVDNMDAAQLISRYDDTQTAFYCDPPYPHSQRTAGSLTKYRHEMTDEQHSELLSVLNDIKGKALVSGYSCPLYDRQLKRWRVCWRHRVPCTSASANERAGWRTEVLWANW